MTHKEGSVIVRLCQKLSRIVKKAMSDLHAIIVEVICVHTHTTVSTGYGTVEELVG